MLERKLILSYDDIDKYSSYFQNTKCTVTRAHIPDSPELTESLLDPTPINSLGVSERIETDKDGNDKTIEVG